MEGGGSANLTTAAPPAGLQCQPWGTWRLLGLGLVLFILLALASLALCRATAVLKSVPSPAPVTWKVSTIYSSTMYLQHLHTTIYLIYLKHIYNIFSSAEDLLTQTQIKYDCLAKTPPSTSSK